MVEPTETESPQTVAALADAFLQIANEALEAGNCRGGAGCAPHDSGRSPRRRPGGTKARGDLRPAIRRLTTSIARAPRG